MESAVVAAAVSPTVEDLYRTDADRLWRALYGFAADADIASDALAEAYAQLMRRGGAVRDPQAWTWRAAFRIARGALKNRSQGTKMIPAAPPQMDRYSDPDLIAALAQLPPGQRVAVVLFYYVDLPVGEIARRTSSNSLAVRANLSRGRRRLRELLGERNG